MILGGEGRFLCLLELTTALEEVLCTLGEVVGLKLDEEEFSRASRLLTTVGGRVSWIMWPGKYS